MSLTKPDREMCWVTKPSIHVRTVPGYCCFWSHIEPLEQNQLSANSIVKIILPPFFTRKREKGFSLPSDYCKRGDVVDEAKCPEYTLASSISLGSFERDIYSPAFCGRDWFGLSNIHFAVSSRWVEEWACCSLWMSSHALRLRHLQYFLNSGQVAPLLTKWLSVTSLIEAATVLDQM